MSKRLKLLIMSVHKIVVTGDTRNFRKSFSSLNNLRKWVLDNRDELGENSRCEIYQLKEDGDTTYRTRSTYNSVWRIADSYLNSMGSCKLVIYFKYKNTTQVLKYVINTSLNKYDEMKKSNTLIAEIFPNHKNEIDLIYHIGNPSKSDCLALDKQYEAIKIKELRESIYSRLVGLLGTKWMGGAWTTIDDPIIHAKTEEELKLLETILCDLDIFHEFVRLGKNYWYGDTHSVEFMMKCLQEQRGCSLESWLTQYPYFSSTRKYGSHNAPATLILDDLIKSGVYDIWNDCYKSK